MPGLEMLDVDIHDMSDEIDSHNPHDPSRQARYMEEGELLIAGLGGLGCAWAKAAHARVSKWVDLALIDADDSSMEDGRHANCLLLGDSPSEVGVLCPHHK